MPINDHPPRCPPSIACGSGHDTPQCSSGQAASSGVYAAYLAQSGFTGASNIFAGKFGFYELYQPGGYDLSRLTDALAPSFAATS